MAPSPNLVLRSAELTVEIAPLGAELQRVTTADGRELLWDGDPAFWTGRAPILFPIVGVLRDDGYRLDGERYTLEKHGFARTSLFTVIQAEPAVVTLRLQASAKTRAVYPFDFQLDIRFSVSGAALTVEATISNLGAQSMPASFGFHPALRWPLPFGRPRSEHAICFENEEPESIRRIDAEGLLTAEPHPTPVSDKQLLLRDALFADDALIFDRLSSRTVTYGAPTGPQIRVDFQDFSMLGVWTKPGAGFVCIEPWAGLADPEGFTGDLREKPGIFEVAAAGSRTLSMTISLTPPVEA